MRMYSGRIGVLMTIVGVATLAACHNASTAPQIAGSVTAVLGDSQRVAVGAAATPLSVRILTSDGEALAGQTVTWSIVSGDGQLPAPTSVSDAEGFASIGFTPNSAGTDVIAASVSALANPTDFTIIATDTTTASSTASGN